MPEATLAPTPVYNKNHPFMASLVERRALSKPGSLKNTQHVVVSFAGSGLTYTCGDSLGVWPENDPELVTLLINTLCVSGGLQVVLPKFETSVSLQEAFLKHLSLMSPAKKAFEWLLPQLKDLDEQARLKSLLSPEAAEELKAYVSTHDWVDFFTDFPSAIPGLNIQELVEHMRRMVPRLYSIASSPTKYPEEVHLTVAVVNEEHRGRVRKGVATTYLAERAPLNTPALPVFMAKSPFSLPEDDTVDVIMVGPGTGVAPFRGFLQERIARGATGRNWLFFGEQHKACDYLYEEELTAWESSKDLYRLDLAFSRDQDHKIYVQHKMLENAAELWVWLQGGAHFYVCGDAAYMAKDVDRALHQICEEQGRMNAEEAIQFIKDLRKSKRYQRDVY
ncbi:MAG: hypothetical protein Tsb0018_05280 [Opitutales bacterium]|tara:strand:- start:3355 stop:4530 length:1176 start_codon:yes stop_codon:yes gene_type:complete